MLTYAEQYNRNVDIIHTGRWAVLETDQAVMILTYVGWCGDFGGWHRHLFYSGNWLLWIDTVPSVNCVVTV